MSGREYVLFGGDTTCLEIRTADDEIVVVDAGSGIRRLGNRLMDEGRSRLTMLFTHSHWDHILGFPFFKPIYSPSTHIDLFGCPMGQGNVELLLSKTMAAPYFPVPYSALKARIEYKGVCGERLSVGRLRVTSIPLSHPNLGLGYRFEEDGRSFVFLTDNEPAHPHPGGRSAEEYAAFSRGADVLMHDAEYTEADYALTRGWGHSLYTDALDLALRADVGSFFLFHHNQNRSDAALKEMVADCRRLADAAGRPEMGVAAAAQDLEIEL
ncbi:MBL fold metallo-hydrolase [Desulfovibrio sp. X2]|uniref:MBL fold metallo-hydrolase n=1 Tax=Desulfovibrio sp. X2 TaxID=941449 RepID=UPI00041FABD0|nr:MBL fold metallo-hydrolase [Desulfovibrio sp. X2]